MGYPDVHGSYEKTGSDDQVTRVSRDRATITDALDHLSTVIGGVVSDVDSLYSKLQPVVPDQAVAKPMPGGTLHEISNDMSPVQVAVSRAIDELTIQRQRLATLLDAIDL